MLITARLCPLFLVPEQACGLDGGPTLIPHCTAAMPCWHRISWELPLSVSSPSVSTVLANWLLPMRVHGGPGWRGAYFRDIPRIGAVHFFLWEGKKPKRRKTGNYLHPWKWGLGPHLANFPAPSPLLMAAEPGPMRDVGESTCCSQALGPGWAPRFSGAFRV